MKEHCHQNQGVGGAPTHVNLPVTVKYQETLAGIEIVRDRGEAEAESATRSDIIGAEVHEMQDYTTAMSGNVMKNGVKNGHVRKGFGMKDLVTTGPVRTDHVMTGSAMIDNEMTGPVRINCAMTGSVRKGHELMDRVVTGHVKTSLEMIACEMISWNAVKKAQATVIVPAPNTVGIKIAPESIPPTITEHHRGGSVPFHPWPGIITNKSVCALLASLPLFFFTAEFWLLESLWLFIHYFSFYCFISRATYCSKCVVVVYSKSIDVIVLF